MGENDRYERTPLFEAIVLKARELHLAGATVLRGPMGFGKSSRLHTAKILRLSEDLPIVVEIVEAVAVVDVVARVVVVETVMEVEVDDVVLVVTGVVDAVVVLLVVVGGC